MGNSNSVLQGLITDVVALLAGYVINFVGCDLIYHNFNIQQSIKGSYWFFLGPILYMFGTTIPWVMALIKTLFIKAKNKISGLFSTWWDSHDPFKVIGLNSTPIVMQYIAEPSFSDENIQSMQSNVDYLKSLGRYKV